MLSFIKSKDAVVAVALTTDQPADTLFINGRVHLPMQSVFKFHIAVKMLTEIDRGHFALHQPIKIKKEQLTPDIWSPLRDKYPKGTTLPLSTLITYMLSQSDNVACDILLQMLGGPQQVQRFYTDQGFTDLAIQINEKTMQQNWDMQFLNWTTVETCSQLLQKYYYNAQAELSKPSHDFLWAVMKGTETGPKRLKGKLPKDAVVAHKTGYSGAKDGVMEAVHDAGVLFLPNGKPIFMTVFISHSKESLQSNEDIIASLSKMAYDYFSAAR